MITIILSILIAHALETQIRKFVKSDFFVYQKNFLYLLFLIFKIDSKEKRKQLHAYVSRGELTLDRIYQGIEYVKDILQKQRGAVSQYD